jgi:23S rRNA pseudouridine1911/1915/1917 synthase
MAKKRADFIRLDFEHRRTLELKVQKDFQGKYRYDYYLAQRCPSYSRSLLQRLIKEKYVTVNDRTIKPSTVVQRGDQIRLELPLILMPQVQPRDIPLEILFEDAHLIAINKPPDFVVHPAAGHWDDTLVNALLHHCGTLPETDEIYKPGIVHRIDKDTSGVILAAKTISAHKGLTAQFADRTTRKEYWAIVEGTVERDADVIDRPMGRSKRD